LIKDIKLAKTRNVAIAEISVLVRNGSVCVYPLKPNDGREIDDMENQMRALAAEGQIVVDGMALEYQILGPSHARSLSIVMLHEGLGSIKTWGEFPRRIFEQTGASIFTYSRAGYGESPPSGHGLPIDYVKRHALDVLPKIMDAIGFQRGILLGHSDGASMAAAYAGNIDDPRVIGLVLIAPHFFVEVETLAEIRNAREAYKIRNLRQRLSRYHTYVDAAFWGWNDVWLEPAFASFNLREELARIRVPMLVLRGDNDRYGTHHQVEIAKDLCGCPLQTLIIPTCGHVPHREQPEQTLNAIARFYRSVALSEEEPVPPKKD
jgi:pimeloyl-ACP methyl ester carboxylesterase